MTKAIKRVTALACAALVAAGGLVQASAAPTDYEDPVGRGTLYGSATKISSTQASATSKFNKGVVPVPSCTVYVRAYIKVNGNKQYGKQEKSNSTSGTATVEGSVNNVSGFGTTGYGGEHIANYVARTTSGDLDRTINLVSSY